MFIVRIRVPIEYHRSKEVYEKHIYFQCKKSPSREQVVKTLKSMHQKCYRGQESEIQKVISVLELMNDWCQVSPSGIIGTNTYVNHPILGEQVVYFDLINPYKI